MRKAFGTWLLLTREAGYEAKSDEEKKHQIFISYTSREEELYQLKPFMEDLLKVLDRRDHQRLLHDLIWLDLHREPASRI
jgi:hypothetical protein